MRTPKELFYIIARVWIMEKQQTHKKPALPLMRYAQETLGLSYEEYALIQKRARQSIRTAHLEARTCGFRTTINPL